MTKTIANAPVRLLHLSDIHLRAGKAWDADPVRRALARYLAGEVQAGLEPDLVAITGDLAFAGKKDEYDLARTWLDRDLWPALTKDPSAPLSHDRLLLVPGNHDADRGKVGKGVRHIQDGLLTERSQEAIAELLEHDDERDIVLKRHAAYLNFYGAWLGTDQPLPWWQRNIGIRGQRLHLAGLDSAWMACGDTDRGRLLLGRYQVNRTLLHKDGEGADWRLALLHHPWDYLAEFDVHEARQTIHRHRDLLLRGHLHHPQSERILPPDPARACLELAAGCVYDGSRYPNASQWIELHAESRRVRVLFRLWNEGAWQIDRHQPGCEDGTADFPLKRPSDATTSPTAPQPPPIPPDYLAWLRRTHGGVDLLGQDAQQGQSIALSQVYVPAVTVPAAPGRAGGGAPANREKQPPALLLERIDRESLYCPAPPGAGKTTFCRWAALQSIPGAPLAHPVPPPEGFAEPLPASLRTRLPLLVPLRELWRVMDCGHGRRTWCRAELTQALAAWVDRTPPDGLTGDLLKVHLARGSAFLLLDGLDEVPVSQPRAGSTLYPRALLLTGLADALPHWEKAGNRTLLTSRPYGLDEAGLAKLRLPRAPLEPLPKPLQGLFVTRWFHTLDKPELAAGLRGSIADRDDLAPLAENPMLLTALCVIYGNGGRLPEDRYRLYQRLVDNVLYNRYPGDARSREPVKARLEAIAHGLHTGAGLEENRRTPNAEASEAELERLLRGFARLSLRRRGLQLPQRPAR